MSFIIIYSVNLPENGFTEKYVKLYEIETTEEQDDYIYSELNKTLTPVDESWDQGSTWIDFNSFPTETPTEYHLEPHLMKTMITDILTKYTIIHE